MSASKTHDVQVNMSQIGLIMKHLTDIYSDPLSAAVRETLTNAIDATKMASRDSWGEVSPVIVAINDVDPEDVVYPDRHYSLSITDRGVGMTETEILDNFANYGNSTKIFDLEQSGSKGLGAKAPLAYVSEFTVESVKNGVSTRVVIAKESTGFKAYVMDSHATNDAPGTSVTFHVHDNYVNKLFTVFETYHATSFDVPVEFYNNASDSALKRDYLSSVNNVDSDNKIIFPAAPDFRHVSTFTLNDNPDDTYRLWVNTSAISINPEKYSTLNIGMWFSGWVYSSGTNSNITPRVSNYNFLVEVLPGAVDFTSSRDDIIMDDKAWSLRKTVESHLMGDVEFCAELMQTFLSINDNDPNAAAANMFAVAKPYIASVARKIEESDADNDAPFENEELNKVWSIASSLSTFCVPVAVEKWGAGDKPNFAFPAIEKKSHSGSVTSAIPQEMTVPKFGSWYNANIGVDTYAMPTKVSSMRSTLPTKAFVVSFDDKTWSKVYRHRNNFFRHFFGNDSGSTCVMCLLIFVRSDDPFTDAHSEALKIARPNTTVTFLSSEEYFGRKMKPEEKPGSVEKKKELPVGGKVFDADAKEMEVVDCYRRDFEDDNNVFIITGGYKFSDPLYMRLAYDAMVKKKPDFASKRVVFISQVSISYKIFVRTIKDTDANVFFVDRHAHNSEKVNEFICTSPTLMVEDLSKESVLSLDELVVLSIGQYMDDDNRYGVPQSRHVFARKYMKLSSDDMTKITTFFDDSNVMDNSKKNISCFGAERELNKRIAEGTVNSCDLTVMTVEQFNRMVSFSRNRSQFFEVLKWEDSPAYSAVVDTLMTRYEVYMTE